MRISTTITANTNRRWINPPMVVLLTKPSNHSTVRTIAIVHNIGSSFRCPSGPAGHLKRASRSPYLRGQVKQRGGLQQWGKTLPGQDPVAQALLLWRGPSFQPLLSMHTRQQTAGTPDRGRHLFLRFHCLPALYRIQPYPMLMCIQQPARPFRLRRVAP